MGGCEGRRERWQERNLRDNRVGGDAGPPLGVERAREEKRRPPGIAGGRTLGSGGKLWGPRGLRSGPLSPTKWNGSRGGARPQ